MIIIKQYVFQNGFNVKMCMLKCYRSYVVILSPYIPMRNNNIHIRLNKQRKKRNNRHDVQSTGIYQLFELLLSDESFIDMYRSD